MPVVYNCVQRSRLLTLAGKEQSGGCDEKEKDSERVEGITQRPSGACTHNGVPKVQQTRPHHLTTCRSLCHYNGLKLSRSCDVLPRGP